MRPSGVALLLSMIGTRTAQQFATRVAELGFTPAQVNVLRLVGRDPGISQQVLAQRLGAAPSRVVKLVDELESVGLIQRHRSAADRRTYELSIPPSAGDRVAALRAAVARHDASVTAALSGSETEQLASLLLKVATAQGLEPDLPASRQQRR